MNICIIGLGLLGGSFSLGLKSRWPGLFVTGVDANKEHCKQVISLGIADQVLPLEEAIKQARLVVLAIPVNGIQNVIKPVLDKLESGSTLLDFGSTKEQICQAVRAHPKRGQYVAGHPIAGTEYSGPQAAFTALLLQKNMIVCDREQSQPESLQLVTEVCAKLEMPLHYMSSKEHDLHLAYVSHLSHISSFALSSTVLEKEKDQQHIFDMAGSGFSSTVRLAKSSPQMWAPIFSHNARNISEALGKYMEQLQAFKESIEKRDEQTTSKLIKNANAIRRILK
jgi:prephenate dehydrogenase